MTPRRWLFAFLAVLTALRLIYAGQSELTPDEAYYFMWSERMDVSFYSKGPGVASTIWLGTHLFGANEFGVRFFSPLLSLGTSLLMFSFARRLYNEQVGLWTTLTINLVPLFNAGSLLMTIDPLSIFFWAGALYTCWLALESGDALRGHDSAGSGQVHLAWWAATGALIGLGFLCKYTNAMQLLSIVLLLAITRRYRRELIRPGFWTMLAAFVPFTLPPIIWNARNDWITLAHLTARAGWQDADDCAPGEPQPLVDFGEFFTFVGSHLGIYSPLIFVGIVLAVIWAWPQARDHFKQRFLLAFGLPLWAMYLVIALKKAGEGNWTAPAMISLAILAVAMWHEAALRSRWKRQFAVAALALGLAISVTAIDTDMLRRAGVPVPYPRDPSKRLRGWRTSSEMLQRVRADFEAKHSRPVFLIANTWGIASALSFYLPDKRVEGPRHPPIYFPESQHVENQYSFWPRYDEFITVPREQLPPDAYFTEQQGINPFHGRSALYITDRAEEKPPSTIKGGFEQVEMIACIDQKRRGQPLRQWRVFACYNYRSQSL